MKEAPRELPFQVIGVGVVLNDAGEVLIDQRLNEGVLGGLWEFPGGKQEPGEAIEATIRRELQEELAIGVEVGEEFLQPCEVPGGFLGVRCDRRVGHFFQRSIEEHRDHQHQQQRGEGRHPVADQQMRPHHDGVLIVHLLALHRSISGENQRLCAA